MQNAGRRCFGTFLALAILYLLIVGLSVTLNKGSRKTGVLENSEWVATSNSWLDRQLCNWVELCGTSHLNSKNWIWDGVEDDLPSPPPSPTPDFSDYWHSGTDDPDSWDEAERERRDIPQYVLDYAPYVHLFSGEQFWPCDLANHLHHTSPYLNYTQILDLGHDVNVTNLDELNDYDRGVHGRFVYLQSEDNVEERPDWLGGDKNIPKAPKAEHPFPGENDELPWPESGDLPESALRSATLQAIAAPVRPQGAMKGPSHLPTLSPSTNGRCGGSTGFTCTGSKFGQCCSIYGWCGNGEDYCGEACEALAGQCNNPFEPRPRPHSELRRRRIIESQNLEPSTKPLYPTNSTSTPVGKSSAPAILIVVKKPDGIVDAFWFFFYSYNLGQKVFNIRFGNHVGDWEHTMLRFRHGIPQAVFLSEHDFGAAYHYRTLEKYLPDPASPPGTSFLGTWSNSSAAAAAGAKRPVVYSAVGSHAMYATPGIHPYILPWGLLHDQTDRGPLWDPALNFQSFVYNTTTKRASSSTLTPHAPVGWFDFAGHWGDKYYPLSDPRQYRFAGQYHYVNGPVGPKFKNLARKSVCQVAPGDNRRGRKCRVKDWVGRDERGGGKFRGPVGPPSRGVGGGETPLDGGEGWDLDGGAEGNRPGNEVEDGGLPGGNVTDDALS